MCLRAHIEIRSTAIPAVLYNDANTNHTAHAICSGCLKKHNKATQLQLSSATLCSLFISRNSLQNLPYQPQ